MKIDLCTNCFQRVVTEVTHCEHCRQIATRQDQHAQAKQRLRLVWTAVLILGVVVIAFGLQMLPK